MRTEMQGWASRDCFTDMSLKSMSDTSACCTPTLMPAVRSILALFAVHSHFHAIDAAQAVS